MQNNGKKKIPGSTIFRLFIYLREVTELARVNIRTISSSELGERINLSDAQVRKDLGYFGQFGVSGSGYAVEELKSALEKILGKDKTWNVAIIGVGHLGSALLAYSGFATHGLKVVAALDADIRKIGKKIIPSVDHDIRNINNGDGGVVIRSIVDLPEVVRKEKVHIGIITTPAREAQDIADMLVTAGVECILNFAPTSLSVPENVKMKDVDLSRELETLSYFLVNKDNGGKR